MSGAGPFSMFDGICMDMGRFHGELHVVNILLEASANPLICDLKGLTPVAECKNPTIRQQLEREERWHRRRAAVLLRANKQALSNTGNVPTTLLGLFRVL